MQSVTIKRVLSKIYSRETKRREDKDKHKENLERTMKFGSVFIETLLTG